MTTTPTTPATSGAGIATFEFWSADRAVREEAFRQLRDQPGLAFHPEMEFEDSPFPVGPGYWSLVRHEDVWAASRNPELFCSGQGSNIGDLPQEMNEFFGSMINMDDPKHFRLRSIVSKGFTPREVARVEEFVKTKAAAVVDRMLRGAPRSAVRLRRGDRRADAAGHHLPDDGHPRRGPPARSSSGRTRSSAPPTPSSAARTRR